MEPPESDLLRLAGCADRSFLAFELQGELSRARLIGALNDAGLAVTLFAAHAADGTAVWNLVEIDDLVTVDDARLRKALAPLAERVARVTNLGAYARPFTPAALAGKA